MKKTKRLIAAFGVALVVFSLVITVVPPFQSTASAAPADNASSEQLVKSYIYTRALARCLQESDIRQKANVSPDREIGEEFAENFSWFSGFTNTYLGMYDPDTDKPNGIKGCSNTDWLKDAAATWGWNGIEAICQAGFRRENADENQNVSDCINGTGPFDRSNGQSGTRERFLRNINSSYYGRNGTSLPTMNDAMRYFYYKNTFIKSCWATERTNNPQSYTDNQVYPNGGGGRIFKITEDDGRTSNFKIWETRDKTASDEVTTRTNDSLGEQKLTCGSMAQNANKFAAAYAAAEGIEPGDASASDGSGNLEIDTTCGVEGWSFLIDPGAILSLDWLACPIIGGLGKLASNLENGIVTMLCVPETDIFAGANRNSCSSFGAASGGGSTADGFFAAWNAFRLLALGVIAIAGLLMVISQALGFEVFDAYTIKKTLPRILIAGIAISLSWQLLEFLISLSNALGIGVRALIYAPFVSADVDTVVMGGGGAALTTLFAAGSFLVLGALGILSFLGTAVLALLVAFVMLVLRNVLIVMLVVLAPLAIAMYTMPNTEKFFKTWWDWLFKALMVFPLITALIAAGHVFAAITSAKAQDSNAAGGLILSFVALAAYIVPYFIVPFAFRFAGGLIGQLGGFVNDRSRGGFDRLRKLRQDQSEKNIKSMANGNRFRGDGRFSRGFNAATENTAAFVLADKGFNPRDWRSAVQAHKSNYGLHEAEQAAKENPAMQSVINNDDFLSAGIRNGGDYSKTRRELIDKGYSETAADQGVAAIRMARRSMSNETFETAAAMALPATGTAFRGGAGEMHELINDVAGNDRQKAARMLAAMRSGASGARRFDMAGGSYGQQLITMEQQYAAHATFKNPTPGQQFTMTDAEGNDVVVTSNDEAIALANEKIIAQSLEGQGGSYVVGARNGAVKNFAPVMRKKVTKAVASGDIDGAVRELAAIAGRYDAAASVAPENAKVLADDVMSKPIEVSEMSPAMRQQFDAAISTYEPVLNSEGRPQKDQSGAPVMQQVGMKRQITIREAVEALRGNTQFLELRKEYGQSGLQGAARAQEAAIQAQIYGQGGPNGGPTPPAPQGPVLGG